MSLSVVFKITQIFWLHLLVDGAIYCFLDALSQFFGAAALPLSISAQGASSRDCSSSRTYFVRHQRLHAPKLRAAHQFKFFFPFASLSLQHGISQRLELFFSWFKHQILSFLSLLLHFCFFFAYQPFFPSRTYSRHCLISYLFFASSSRLSSAFFRLLPLQGNCNISLRLWKRSSRSSLNVLRYSEMLDVERGLTSFLWRFATRNSNDRISIALLAQRTDLMCALIVLRWI